VGRRPPGVEGSCQYTEHAVADSRNRLIFQLGVILMTPNLKEPEYHKTYAVTLSALNTLRTGGVI